MKTTEKTPPLDLEASNPVEKQEVVPMKASDLPVPTNTQQVGEYSGMIKNAIVDPNTDPEKLHRLLDFQERVMAKQAEINYRAAMNRLQLDMPIIAKDGSVSYPIDKNKPDGPKREAFKYASFENIMRAIKPSLMKNGFTFSFDSTPRQGDGGGATITAKLSHVDGHSETSSFAAALDSSGGKNNIQAMGSTFSYGKRYCVTALLNIITEGEDDDGNTDHGDEPIDDVQFQHIQDLIDEGSFDAAAFCTHMGYSSLRDIRQKNYVEATNMLKEKLKIKKAKDQKAGA
jgi:hypothetical protein